MPQNCKTCTSPDVAVINARIIAGEEKATIARSYGLPPHGVARHARHHLSVLSSGVAGHEQPEQVSLVQRLIDSLRDLEAVRQAALMSGNSAHVIRAAAVSNGLIGTLLDRLGVDELSVADDLRNLHSLALAVGVATRAHPATGRLIAGELRAHGLHDDAAALDAVAAKAEQQQIENSQIGIEK